MDIQIHGLKDALAAMDKIEQAASRASFEIVAESAALVESTAKRNFEGAHPRGAPHVGGSAPNVVSGTLRRSVRHTPIVKDGLAGAFSTVGPSVVYGRRVELGFTGADALGRRYHQPPYPYFRPAVEKTAQPMQVIAQRIWGRAVAV